MPGFDESILTDVGWDALTDAEAGQHIEYTHMEAGDGFIYGGDTEIFGMTNLAHHVMDFPITNFSNDGQGQITLVGTISSKNVTAGFYFRELAVRCTIDGGAPILYTVSYAGDTGDYIPASTETPVVIQTVQIIIRIDRAPNVTVIVQPGLDVTCQNIGPATVGPGYFRDKIGQICWFKRINSPKKTLTLTETSDVVSIDIPIIDVNLDMFVALGNPDIFPHFSTIQKALDYIRFLPIKTGVTVTITVSAGNWTSSDTIIVNHAQAEQIQIKGTAGATINVTQAVSGGTGSIVNLTGPVGAFNSLAVGDYFFYFNTASVNGMCISGIQKVTAKAGNGSTITYDAGLYWTMPNLPIGGGTVTPIKTVINFSNSRDGINVLEYGLGLLSNMVLVGGANSSGHDVVGLHVKGGVANASYVGAYGWLKSPNFCTGFVSTAAGGLNCTSCAANKNARGFATGHGASFLSCSNCYGNSNQEHGFASLNGNLTGSATFACGNFLDGFCSLDKGYITLDNCYAVNNKEAGLRTQFNSYIGLGPITGGVSSGSGYRDVLILSLSAVIRFSGTALGYGSANIAPNTLSADGCLFTP